MQMEKGCYGSLSREKKQTQILQMLAAVLGWTYTEFGVNFYEKKHNISKARNVTMKELTDEGFHGSIS